LAQHRQRHGVEADLPRVATRVTRLLRPFDRLPGELGGGREPAGHELGLRHPAEGRGQNRPGLHRGAFVQPAQDRQPLVDAARVGQQPADEVVTPRRGAGRREAPAAPRLEPVQAVEVDAEARVELGLHHGRPDEERDVRIGCRNAGDGLEPVAGGLELARDVVVGQA
jgi:hypothetical protein